MFISFVDLRVVCVCSLVFSVCSWRMRVIEEITTGPPTGKKNFIWKAFKIGEGVRVNKKPNKIRNILTFFQPSFPIFG